jgi:ABC-type nitrate/sulfonate/bicarbonate transport system permease component
MSEAADANVAGAPDVAVKAVLAAPGAGELRATGVAPGRQVQAKHIFGSRSFVTLRSFAVFFLLWYLLSVWTNSPIQLPSSVRVLTALYSLAVSGELFEHAFISIARLIISLLVVLVVAVPLGFLMGVSRTLEAIIDPVVEVLRPISGIAWIPLGLFIFGVGDTLPVFIMVYSAFFPLLLNTISGVRQVDQRLVSAARTMGVGRWAMLRRVVAPGALPTIMVGFRLAFAGAWAAVIAAELIGAPTGLGFAIEWYRELLMSPKVFAFIMVIAIVGYFADLALRALQRRLTPWTEGTGLA